MTQASIPDFAKELWYHDFRDHRCPHDAWLESIQILESATGDRKEIRQTEIVTRLFGAYHDGHILFRHLDVRRYSIEASSSEQGHGDWIRDEISLTEAGLLRHQISWHQGASNKTDWTIECRNITYEWIPEEG